MTLVAGIDSSTQSCKILVCDADSGRIVRSGSAPHPPGTEVDPEAWWTALLAAVDAVGGLGDVAAVAVGGQQHGMVVLDAQGRVIRPALLWNDTRSAPDAEDLIRELGDGDRELGARRWAEAVGSVPVASITVSKLRWLARVEPENAARVAAIALPHDWLTWRLSGATSLQTLATDRSDASGTGYFDSVHNTYRRDLLALGLLRSEAEVADIVLPTVAGPHDAVGAGDVARGWDAIVLGPGCGDNAGAALGLGLGVGDACLSIGTSGVVSSVSDTPTADPSGMVTGFADATGRFLPLACTLNGSRVLDAARAVLDVDHEELSRLALQADPGADGLVLVPYLEGERTPNLPTATGSILGVTLSSMTRPNLARAAVEGVLGLMAGCVDAVTTLGVPVERVALVGGGAEVGGHPPAGSRAPRGPRRRARSGRVGGDRCRPSGGVGPVRFGRTSDLEPRVRHERSRGGCRGARPLPGRRLRGGRRSGSARRDRRLAREVPSRLHPPAGGAPTAAATSRAGPARSPGSGDLQPLGPAVVEDEPGDEAVARLPRVIGYRTGGELGGPLVMAVERGEAVDEGDVAPPAHVGLGFDEHGEAVVDLTVRGRRRTDDEGGDAVARRVVEEVGEVEPVPGEGESGRDVIGAGRDDEPALGAALPAQRHLAAPAAEEVSRGVAPDAEVVGRELDVRMLGAADDPGHPALALGITEPDDERGAEEHQCDIAVPLRGHDDLWARRELDVLGVLGHLRS